MTVEHLLLANAVLLLLILLEVAQLLSRLKLLRMQAERSAKEVVERLDKLVDLADRQIGVQLEVRDAVRKGPVLSDDGEAGKERIIQLRPGIKAVPAADRALFEKLRAKRLELAKAQSVPPYVIFHDRTLAEMAASSPRSDAELAAIPGISEAKLARYGKAFLEIINGHNMRAGEDIRPDEPLPPSALPSPAYEEHLATIKQRHARAYEKWTQEEDTELLSLYAAGIPLPQLATHFQRQPSAVRSRLAKLSPVSDLETS